MHRILAPLALSAVLLAACGPAARPSAGPAPRPGPDLPGTGITHIDYVPVSPALPAIPAVNGALAIRVIEPSGGGAQPRSDSIIIYGSVGNGRAGLEINGTPVAVAPNGAFIAYLPRPADRTWRLRATLGGQEVTREIAYAAPATGSTGTGASGAPANAVYATARLATVNRGGDTLATGSDAIYARPTPTGTYRWFFPRGARLSVVERRGTQYRVRLDPSTEAWVDADKVGLADTTTAAPADGTIAAARLVRAADGVDLRIAAAGRPFLVEPTDSAVRVTVYGATGTVAPRSEPAPDAWFRGVAQGTAAGGSPQYMVMTSSPAWGYKAWYEADGTLVIRIRRPPAIDASNPLRGRRIVIDPGHPPAGATGPTGLYEGDANLAISLPLAEKLRARGAEVILTRTGREELELAPRVETAVRTNAELLISVHNNAFGEGQNPFRAQGTSVYWFHPMSAALATTLDREIVGVTRIRDIGARQSNLALARPTWMPSALTESLFMPIPEQEAALRDPAFLDRLAEAHVRGIEAFLRERAAAGGR
ncbi:MAG TPA: N-acetylmuramoyl-L-alanine amidase [Longimicrobium sp.]|uniref:N-acetylmuramoyl-L-alanine amidase family protein n=1 Tax=Longimicrobium sp. TaxID=2029185 RepID=UPI002EDB55C5